MATAKTADLTVVGGAGHVGIPLVLSFAAKGLTVNINDINEQTLATLKCRTCAVHREQRATAADLGAGRQASVLHQPAERNIDLRPGDRHHRHAG